MIPIVNGNGSGGGLLIINADKVQYQDHGSNATDSYENDDDVAIPPQPERLPLQPLSPVLEAREPAEERDAAFLEQRDIRMPTSPEGILSSGAVASPTSTVRSMFPFGKRLGGVPSEAVASPTSTIRHLFPVGKRLDELHEMKVQQLREQQDIQAPSNKQEQQVDAKRNDDPKNCTETDLEDVIVAISNFKLQAQKLGLSESKILEVLKETSVPDNNNKETDRLKTTSPRFLVHCQQKAQLEDRRLNSTIDVIKKQKGSFGLSTVSSLTYKGPQ
ncbi:MAG: hypothetical protein SGARI_003266 [Bacillariaceae sp.]